jgi:hypothetical protein
MTNYDEYEREVSLEMLSSFLFPPGKTRMVNDMESCAYGVLSLHNKSVISSYFEPMFGRIQDHLEQGNCVSVPLFPSHTNFGAFMVLCFSH